MDVSLPPPWDKFAHASAFGALAFALDLALRLTARSLPIYRRHLTVLALVALFAASDEWHQHFVPGRSCDIVDWLADLVGAILALKLAVLPYLWTRKLQGASWQTGKPWRPDPSKPLILVADTHWSEELTSLHEATLAYPKADWLFLGDVFDLWLGLPNLQTDAQRAFLWWVAERRIAGNWVGFWMGNREYFLDRFAHCFDYMGEGVGGELPDEKLAFEHGDLVNARDWKYRLWNLISHSAPMWLLMRGLPGKFTEGLARKLEQSMSRSGRGLTNTFPQESFRSAVDERPKEWMFLTGHFHIHREEGNGTALPWARETGFWVWDGIRARPLELPRPSTHLQNVGP
jgi:UDP-2,3-diacylglucosamine pyrophosphatase LpxH